MKIKCQLFSSIFYIYFYILLCQVKLQKFEKSADVGSAQQSAFSVLVISMYIMISKHYDTQESCLLLECNELQDIYSPSLPTFRWQFINVLGSVDTENELYKNGFSLCTSVLTSLIINTKSCLGFDIPLVTLELPALVCYCLFQRLHTSTARGYPNTGEGQNAGKSNRDCKEGYVAAWRRETSNVSWKI